MDDLQVGDCLVEMPDRDLVRRVSTVACHVSHGAEVFGRYDLPHSAAYPGQREVDCSADAGCLERFQAYVGHDLEDSALDFSTLAPTQEAWDDGDRVVMCVAEGRGLVGSVRGTRR